MKYLLITFIFLIHTINASSQAKKKSSIPKAKPQIHWMSIDEVQEQIKVLPKKIYIDIYSDGDGWCKIMQSKAFSNKNVISYLNENFYAIHLNAETADSIYFKNKMYGRIEGSKINELVYEFMNNQISYPFSIFFDEKFSDPHPIPGYMDVPTFEMILKYMATDQYKKVKFGKYKNEFKGTW